MKIRIYETNQLSFFPLYASTVSINYPQHRTIRTDGFEMHQIFLVSAGSGILKIDGKTYILNTNDFFYISANIPHEYYGCDNNFTTIFLSFFGNGFDGIKKYYKLDKFGIYRNKNKGQFEASIQNLYNVFDTSHEISSLCSLAFSTVISYFDEACKKEYSTIETVYKYIEENHAKMITLDEILQIYPYSKAKLCREFKLKYNLTIFEMVTKIRLRHARYMINNYPNTRLESIATSCGFNDVSYFCKMYKRAYGFSPKASKN